ncbi:AraC family transcriptional regulator [Paraburkholderia humisilvae]|uniref:HTH-type transcriptional activator RhaS n=1 Tax=Paraburkholderia humisilvae TaxID=627669 RepID=A0A6J5DCE2_9BURK|nr:AraC family transcriptional regulator [Paraburkholderia humisilvae]CAB3751920.1 HTH-type transcriptional activator RhaS [Paraburkholderia humisilvae]
MNTSLCDKRWNGRPTDNHGWINAVSTQGWACRLDADRSGPSTIDIVHAGQTEIASVSAAWQSLSPILHRVSAPWNGEHVLVKIVQSGLMSIEQRQQTTTFGPGDIAVLDPQHMFNQSIGERTRVLALCIPKSALRERGLRHRFPTVSCPNPESPDVGVVREFVLYMASQARKASEPLLARLGDQCLDLLDVLVNHRDRSGPVRSSAVTALRAKQVIARSLGDPELCIARIAAELNMSPRSLARALQADGLSAMRYAWSLRLEHAARLLPGATQGEIKTIAHQCGFASPAHFSRAFKERYGMTPREYAANHKTTSVDGPQ